MSHSNSIFRYCCTSSLRSGTFILFIGIYSDAFSFNRKLFLSRTQVRSNPVPRVIVTDKNPSYGAAKGNMCPSLEHRQHKGLNNRAEVSHQPTRQMRGFKSPKQAQILLSNQIEFYNRFRLRKRDISAAEYRKKMRESFTIYKEELC